MQKESDLSLVGRISTHVESFSWFFLIRGSENLTLKAS